MMGTYENISKCKRGITRKTKINIDLPLDFIKSPAYSVYDTATFTKTLMNAAARYHIIRL